MRKVKNFVQIIDGLFCKIEKRRIVQDLAPRRVLKKINHKAFIFAAFWKFLTWDIKNLKFIIRILNVNQVWLFLSSSSSEIVEISHPLQKKLHIISQPHCRMEFFIKFLILIQQAEYLLNKPFGEDIQYQLFQLHEFHQ